MKKTLKALISALLIVCLLLPWPWAARAGVVALLTLAVTDVGSADSAVGRQGGGVSHRWSFRWQGQVTGCPPR